MILAVILTQFEVGMEVCPWIQLRSTSALQDAGRSHSFAERRPRLESSQSETRGNWDRSAKRYCTSQAPLSPSNLRTRDTVARMNSQEPTGPHAHFPLAHRWTGG